MGGKLYSPALQHMMPVTHPLWKCSKFENHWRSSVAHGSRVPGILQQIDRSQLQFDCYRIERLPTEHQLCLQRREVVRMYIINHMFKVILDMYCMEKISGLLLKAVLDMNSIKTMRQNS